MSQPYRAKVYILAADGSWEDSGTGFVDVSADNRIVLVSESDPLHTLVSLPMDDTGSFRRQQDAIINWEAVDGSRDFALSFQDSRGADSIWRSIQAQSSPHEPPLSEDVIMSDDAAARVEDVQLDDSMLDASLGSTAESQPAVLDSNLDFLLSPDVSPSSRADVATRLLRDGAAALRAAVSRGGMHDPVDEGEAHKLATHARAILMTADAAVYTALVSNSDVYTGMLGLCESLMQNSGRGAIPLRASAQTQVVSGAVFITDASLSDALLHTHRLSFIRDCVLSRHFDEIAHGVLANLIAQSCTDVFSTLTSTHTQAIEKAVAAIRNAPTGVPHVLEPADVPATICCVCNDGDEGATLSRSARERAVAFLFESVHACKCTSLQLRAQFIRACLDVPGGTMVAAGNAFLTALEKVLCDRFARLSEVTQVLELVQACIAVDTTSVRTHISRQKRHPPSHSLVDDDAPMYARTHTEVWDDGRSIRLCEKLVNVGVLTAFPHACVDTSAGADAAARSYARAHTRVGEHGWLVPAPDTHSGLMHMLVWRMVDDPCASVCIASSECIRQLVDTDTLTPAERDVFLTMFYDHYWPWMMRPFLHPGLEKVHNCPAAEVCNVAARAGAVSASTYSLAMWLRDVAAPALGRGFGRVVAQGQEQFHAGRESSVARVAKACALDCMRQFVQQHTFRIKYILLRSDLVLHVTRLLRYRDRCLVLAVLQMLRACVCIENDFYNRALVKHDILSAITAVMCMHACRDDAVMSACDSLMAYINTHATTALLRDHIRAHYQPMMDLIRRVRPTSATAAGAAATDSESVSDSATLVASASKRPAGADDDAEERYFSEDVDADVDVDDGANVLPYVAARSRAGTAGTAASVESASFTSASMLHRERAAVPAPAAPINSKDGMDVFDFVDDLMPAAASSPYAAAATSSILDIVLPMRRRRSEDDEDAVFARSHTVLQGDASTLSRPAASTASRKLAGGVLKGKLTFAIKTTSLPAVPVTPSTDVVMEDAGASATVADADRHGVVAAAVDGVRLAADDLQVAPDTTSSSTTTTAVMMDTAAAPAVTSSDDVR